MLIPSSFLVALQNNSMCFSIGRFFFHPHASLCNVGQMSFISTDKTTQWSVYCLIKQLCSSVCGWHNLLWGDRKFHTGVWCPLNYVYMNVVMITLCRILDKVFSSTERQQRTYFLEHKHCANKSNVQSSPSQKNSLETLLSSASVQLWIHVDTL